MTEFNARNKILIAKLLQQGYQYHKFKKPFSKFYRRHYEFKVEGRIKISFATGPMGNRIYGDLVYKMKKNVSRSDFLVSSEELSYVTNVLDTI